MNEAEVYKWVTLTRSMLWTIKKLISVKFWLNAKCSKMWLKLPSPNGEQCGWRWVTLSFSLRHCHPFQLFYISFSIMQLMRTWSGGKGAKLGWPPVLLQLHLGAEQSIQAWVPALEGNGVSAYRNRRKPPSVPAAREGTWDTGTHCCQHELLLCPLTRYIFYLEKLIPISSIAFRKLKSLWRNLIPKSALANIARRQGLRVT